MQPTQVSLAVFACLVCVTGASMVMRGGLNLRGFQGPSIDRTLRLKGGNAAVANAVDTKYYSTSAADVRPGLNFHEDKEVSFRLWAPHAARAEFQIEKGEDNIISIPLFRDGHTWVSRFAKGTVDKSTKYRVALFNEDGSVLYRRDPYAHQTDYNSSWCFADDPASFTWTEPAACPRAYPPAFDEYVIYELHVGSFTPQGTFAGVADKLEYIASLGYTAIQLMPISEHADAWGYNPRQLLALHGAYGTPDDLRNLVDKAHRLGVAVIVDVVLHHGSVDRNELWEYDGWQQDGNGGIYHEGAPDTEWGRGYAFWKSEVLGMVRDACSMWLTDYRVDGLRFDSANDLPREAIHHLTWNLREKFPGRLLCAEVTPENPQSVHDLGFDSVWVHSGYFDIIHQHRALGRGHHGGGDWAAGWDLPKLRTAMALHPGFTSPTQCIKYFMGSHDQIGCRKGGAWYQDYILIGGNHRYPCDQYGGGRGDVHCRACSRLWYSANVAAAGLVMTFMGTEWAQSGWWNNDEFHSPNWDQCEDDVGKGMRACFQAANNLRKTYPALRKGWANILHEDRPNGVVAWERVCEGEARMLCVVNAGRRFWHGREYGLWVGGGGPFVEVHNSQDAAFGGMAGSVSNAGGEVPTDHGKLWISIPAQSCLVFRQV